MQRYELKQPSSKLNFKLEPLIILFILGIYTLHSMKGGGSRDSIHWTEDFMHRHFGFTEVHTNPEFCVTGLDTMLKYLSLFFK